jgi:hypothetical protein
MNKNFFEKTPYQIRDCNDKEKKDKFFLLRPSDFIV